MVAQFPAHKPVNFASLTDNVIVIFSKSFGETLILNANTANKNSFPAPKSDRVSRNGPSGLHIIIDFQAVLYRLIFGEQKLSAYQNSQNCQNFFL